MVNFGPLTADIGSGVCGTPANFNGFRVLAALRHSTHSTGRQPNFAALNRGRHLYSAGRPPRWALAHILVCPLSQFTIQLYNYRRILGLAENLLKYCHQTASLAFIFYKI